MTKGILGIVTALSCAAAITACGGGGTGTGGGSTNTGGAGTGGTGTGGTAPNLTLEQACDQLAAAECDVYERCKPALMLAAYNGDKALCTSRRKTICVAASSLPGVTAKPASVASCAQATGAVDCVGSFDDLPACDFRGSKEDGSACAVGRECKSGWCVNIGSTGCGTCQPQLAEGAACDPSQGCGRLVCSNEGHCHPYALLGESCDDYAFPCNPLLQCDATSKKCVPQLQEGATCPSPFDCDAYQQLSCSTAQKCVKGMVVPAGGFCSNRFCQNSSCELVGSDAKCVAFLADGDVCDGTTRCQPPARCTAQKCRIEPPTCN